MTTDYLTVGDVLDIHADQIERYGGAEGIRDLAQLEAAVARPQAGYYPDLVAEAAALWESLSQNHPFIDGNKRTAFSSMFRFLALNGIEITADAEEVWQFLSRAYENLSISHGLLDSWLRQHTRTTTG